MQRNTLYCLLAVAVLSGCAATEPLSPTTADIAPEPALSSDQQKSSYAQGVAYIQDLSKFDIPLDQKLFVQGINDVLQKRPLRLDDTELQKGKDWVFVQTLIFNDRKAKANREQGQAFLEANKSKPGVVTTASGLQYKPLESGKSQRKPTLNDSAKIYYRISRLNGQELTNSYSKSAPELVYVNQLIPGWQEAIQLMPEGAKWQLYIPADLAYGDNGAPGRIEPGETLIYDISLVSIDTSETTRKQNTGKQTLRADEMKKTSSWKSH